MVNAEGEWWNACRPRRLEGLPSGSGRPGTQVADALDGAVEDRRFRRGQHTLVDQRFYKIDHRKAASRSFADDCVGNSDCNLHDWRFPCRAYRQLEAVTEGKCQNRAAAEEMPLSSRTQVHEENKCTRTPAILLLHFAVALALAFPER